MENFPLLIPVLSKHCASDLYLNLMGNFILQTLLLLLLLPPEGRKPLVVMWTDFISFFLAKGGRTFQVS